jgi:hypothetical protein
MKPSCNSERTLGEQKCEMDCETTLVLPRAVLLSYCNYGGKWSEREDLNLRPLVSQTSALTGLRHAPMPFP